MWAGKLGYIEKVSNTTKSSEENDPGLVVVNRLSAIDSSDRPFRLSVPSLHFSRTTYGSIG